MVEDVVDTRSLTVETIDKETQRNDVAAFKILSSSAVGFRHFWYDFFTENDAVFQRNVVVVDRQASVFIWCEAETQM